MKCRFCNHEQVVDDVVYCTNCGSRLSKDSSQASVSDRLKFWGGESRILSVFFVNFTGFEQLMDRQIDRWSDKAKTYFPLTGIAFVMLLV